MFQAMMQTVLAAITIAGITLPGEHPIRRPEASAAVESGQSTARSGREPLARVQHTTQAGDRSRNPRVLFVTAKDCARCDQELARLRRPGGDFEKMQALGWKIGEGTENHLQIVDQDTIPDLIRELNLREFPTVACIRDGEIVRSFKSGCTTPLDAWTFGFLAKGIDERPPGAVLEAARVETTGHYSLRGNHWSIDEDWTPTREKVVSHLRGPNHGHQILKNWEIERWSYEELRSLHDNLHEREMGGVSYSTRSQSSDQFSATRKSMGR
jgi:sulfur carrier protein ThiS